MNIQINLTTLLELGLVTALVAAIAVISTERTPPGKKTTATTGTGALPGDSSGVEVKKSKKKKSAKKAGQVSTAASEDKAHQAGNDAATTTRTTETHAEAVPKSVVNEAESSDRKKQNKSQTQSGRKEAAVAKQSSAQTTQKQPASQQLASTTPQTEVEKRSKPEPETAVSDMRDEEHDPQVKLARVIKVVGGKVGAKPEPARKHNDQDEWERFDDQDQEDEGEWEMATSKKPNKSTSTGLPSASAVYAASNPSPARSIPGLSASAQHALTKKQRENQKKAEKSAAAKDEAERERLERLARHRRELERVRMMEQERDRNKGKAPKSSGPRSQTFETRPKMTSGGMSASLDSDGHLIWD